MRGSGVCVCVHTWVGMCIHVHMYMYIYVHMYTHIYVHMYTYIYARPNTTHCSLPLSRMCVHVMRYSQVSSSSEYEGQTNCSATAPQGGYTRYDLLTTGSTLLPPYLYGHMQGGLHALHNLLATKSKS